MSLSAATGKASSSQSSEDEGKGWNCFGNCNENGSEHSDDLDEFHEEKENKKVIESSEGESGVGSSASSIVSKNVTFVLNQVIDQVPPPAPSRFSKTSLLAPPTSAELKAVVKSGTTKSVTQGPQGPLKPVRRPVQQTSTVLTALRRAMSKERMRRVELAPKA